MSDVDDPTTSTSDLADSATDVDNSRAPDGSSKSDLDDARVPRGRVLSLVAFVLGATVALITAALAGDSDVAGRIALVGLAVFGLALAIGSPRLVGASTLPVLGAALIASAAADEPAWVRSILLGCAWYVAVELGWDAIERRDGVTRPRSLDQRRIHEITTVVTLSLIVTISGVVASDLAPQRTFFVQAPIILAVLVALGVGIRRLTIRTT